MKKAHLLIYSPIYYIQQTTCQSQVYLSAGNFKMKDMTDYDYMSDGASMHYDITCASAINVINTLFVFVCVLYTKSELAI